MGATALGEKLMSEKMSEESRKNRLQKRTQASSTLGRNQPYACKDRFGDSKYLRSIFNNVFTE